MELDIVALSLSEKKAFIAEVKRHGKNFKPEQFKSKVDHLHDKILHGYEITSTLLTLNEM